MRKAAILLPGIGYTIDRSLLYYAGKIAQADGYKLIPVPYTGFQKGIKGNSAKMREAFEHALAEAEKILTPQLIENGLLDPHGLTKTAETADILFISKSIGTAVAAEYECRHELNARNVYYTPLGETFRPVRRGGYGSDGIAFHGTADPWAGDEEIICPCRELQIPLNLIPDANHSLETGDVLKDVSRLGDIMEKTANYIVGRIHF